MDAASLVVSVLSLGLQVHEGLSSYINAIKARSEELSSTDRQNQRLQQLLVLTAARVLDLQRKYPQSTSHTFTCLQLCEDEIRALDDLLTSLGDSTASSISTTPTMPPTTSTVVKFKNCAKRLAYPLNRGQIQKLEERVSRANSALQNALHTLGLYVAFSS
jgi:hypothetical protein